ncbi:MAG: hypothetical protein JL50_14460 [Peptococcaceae bacterium BICA1-7]|nr:MAG: hypothetical protein JL50_14460 [Peptococcaceae bacterium BICA1-7]
MYPVAFGLISILRRKNNVNRKSGRCQHYKGWFFVDRKTPGASQGIFLNQSGSYASLFSR